MLPRACLVLCLLGLTGCSDLPCADLGEDACLADEKCAASYVESCGCSCDEPACGAGCCEFDICVDAN